MKRLFIVFILAILISLLPLNACSETGGAEYLRIHIRANSDSAADQSVKYAVRDGIVEYLTPFVKGCVSKNRAMRIVEEKLSAITARAEEILREKGFYYGANARLNRENFPTRVYGELTLEGGEYDALIVELGRGEGANWWCVVYPPLCFSGGEEVKYKSLIVEWWQKLFS